MLAPGEVIEKAKTYLGQVVPEFAALNPKVDEMRLMPESLEWQITFFANRGDLNPTPKSLAEIIQTHRILKTVIVAANDGSLVAIRNPY